MSSTDRYPQTSQSLLLRLRNHGDIQSWEEFESIYAPMIRAYCQRRGIQSSDVDDVVQDVMTSVAKSMTHFEYDPKAGKFRAWFGTIVTNRVRSYFAISGRNESQNIESIEQIVDAGSGADGEWSQVYHEQLFRVACDRVKDRVDVVTWLCFEETWLKDKKAPEVAEKLGVPIHSVYVNKSRVLKCLEQEVCALADFLPELDVSTKSNGNLQ